MILISRLLVRKFRSVARHAGLCKAGSRVVARVRLLATPEALTIQATNGDITVENRTPGSFDAADISVPMQLFAACEANSEVPVTIRVDNDRIIAAWDDRGVPQQQEYEISSHNFEMPTTPHQLSMNGPNLLVALRDARATADTTATRYALNSIQLKGATGTIVATDSRQLLVQTGFRFPWEDDVLIPASNVFASGEFSEESTVEIGRTEKAVTVRIAAWTIHHAIRTEGQFPKKIDEIIPADMAVATRMQIDDGDAKFLKETVSRLPADDEGDRPLTVDLNGAVVVRARKDAQSIVTELVLSRSRSVGAELRLQTNRTYLARAVQLGFREVGFVNAESPCVCRDARRTYVWMLLENKNALQATAEAVRIESSSALGNPVPNTEPANSAAVNAGARNRPRQTAAITPVNRVASHLCSQTKEETTARNEIAPLLAPAHSGDLIECTLAVRTKLRSLVQDLTDLVVQIRQQRKQSRLMKSTLQSLKQLQLQDA